MPKTKIASLRCWTTFNPALVRRPGINEYGLNHVRTQLCSCGRHSECARRKECGILRRDCLEDKRSLLKDLGVKMADYPWRTSFRSKEYQRYLKARKREEKAIAKRLGSAVRRCKPYVISVRPLKAR